MDTLLSRQVPLVHTPKVGTRTLICLRRNEWPPGWIGLKYPVAPLVLELYSHPDAGACLETWTDEETTPIGYLAFDGWSGGDMHFL